MLKTLVNLVHVFSSLFSYKIGFLALYSRFSAYDDISVCLLIVVWACFPNNIAELFSSRL